MIRTRYYIGLNDRHGKPLRDRVVDEVREAAGKLYGGFTEYRATGYWQGATEPSLVLEVLSDNTIPTASVHAKAFAAIADQTSVLWTSEHVNAGFSR